MSHATDPATTLDALAADRVIAVVRAPVVPDPVALCEALRAGGIRWVELTFTTPGLDDLLRRATDHGDGVLVGAGTVTTAEQAAAAADAGARYLVTPGLRPEVAEVAHDRSLPVVMGALTPTEVGRALDLGATAVKIFPAHAFGPRHFRDLAGPYPGVPLVASGGVNAGNAAEFLRAGALSVCAGSDVVPPAAVAAGDWESITARAREFVAAL
ncbi:bifunctional 4-hydroxy-2-oxoglutarate aldolase/2-dehydro-3-deoxy-phosphogluconate aldolase [Streptomyces lonarensis]|uniref:Bifunctional 4-hydroxy-2-oxoglutarate aldolase/2-dehydro-3-deoxy-phosphogluconate aldolase n=1 Tax=Streptomyces lonarensis TaxID=700599 RepID=A0A7X6HX56_9ACTN|nr:bifunctional 4-hydroxy-2-oxoglutarate aldolase/2-dehydro-3-deoxy-phosphogluconate aldolase [Streptomyces lonarensis]NJQ04196.1 bifunctional 4-hydroxy-2-oxoglutarate aldolase/2-dehydro-3-deoxy-phosphogluconate aldolase [Streptomyces lonarensis]